MNIATHPHCSPFISSPPKPEKLTKTRYVNANANAEKKVISGRRRRKLSIMASAAGGEAERRSFLTLEEAGLVEISGLSSHEKFLCRLTISSLNLLKVISEQEGCAIEELNAGKVCDWFLKDKLKREQSIESATLQWEDSDFPF